MAQSAPGLSSTDIPPTLCFYDSPAEHWLHLKTSSAIESTFATVRLRTKVTKGPGSRAAGLAMAFKLIEAAEDRWSVPARPSERGCWSRALRSKRRSPRDQRVGSIHNS
jgi:transposase-like protein